MFYEKTFVACNTRAGIVLSKNSIIAHLKILFNNLSVKGGLCLSLGICGCRYGLKFLFVIQFISIMERAQEKESDRTKKRKREEFLKERKRDDLECENLKVLYNYH